MLKKQEKRDILFKALVLLITCALTFCYLLTQENNVPRIVCSDGAYTLTREQLVQDVWLLDKVSGESILIRLEEDAFLSVTEHSAERLTVNGMAAQALAMGARRLVPLTAGSNEIGLNAYASGNNMLRMGMDKFEVGLSDMFFRHEQDARHSQGFYNGFSIFSILFALTLFAFKPSEKYLLSYVLHALVFCAMSMGSQVISVFPVFARWQAGLASLWSCLNVYGILSLVYPLFTAVIHWLLYRVFVDDRIFGVRYPAYLFGVYALIAAAMLVARGTLDSQWMFFLFYFLVYLCEGFILLVNPPKEDQKLFGLILLTAWCASFLFWFVRTVTNLGFIEYPASMGSLIAVCYTIGFLVCINGRFSRKFLLADQLLQQTKHMNEHLEELVDQKTRDLQNSYAHLEQVQREKNEFVSNIIHNLKTPLFSLRGYAELLGEEMDGQSEAAKEYLALVCGNVDYAQAMIRHLLLFSRLEERRVVFRKIDFNLGAMLERLAEECGVRLQEKTLSLYTDVDMPLTLCGDELYLRQAMQNIVDNAIEHSHPGGEIHLTGKRIGENVQITVRDFGEGMDKDVLPHIMERCYSYHADGQKSSGLGLNIAKAIVDAHGGEIRAESVVGEGSVFTLTLPMCQAEEEMDNEL